MMRKQVRALSGLRSQLLRRLPVGMAGQVRTEAGRVADGGRATAEWILSFAKKKQDSRRNGRPINDQIGRKLRNPKTPKPDEKRADGDENSKKDKDFEDLGVNDLQKQLEEARKRLREHLNLGDEDKEDKEEDKGGRNAPKDSGKHDENKHSSRRRNRAYLTYMYGITAAVVGSSFIMAMAEQTVIGEIPYSKFFELLRDRQVTAVDVVVDLERIRKHYYVVVKTKPSESPPQNSSPTSGAKGAQPTSGLPLGRAWMYVLNVDSFLANLEAEMKALHYDAKDFVPVKFVNHVSPVQAFKKILMDAFVTMAALFILYSAKDVKVFLERMMPRAGKAIKTFEVKKLQGGFDSVAGLDNAKLEIHEFVDFLKNPFIYASLGARMPKGALLTGPPGTGKTLLAKACAVESGVSFFAVSGSDFVEKYVGIGSQNVRKLFQEAKLRAPSVIFIDEIDAIGKKRNETAMFTNTERENTLNQLLVELDGFDSKTSVVVLAATNRPEILDPALRRPGRLDRHIALTLPDLKAREEIFRLYLAKLKIDQSNLEYLAKRLASLSPQFSGADISNLCNEAAILAAREETELIQLRHFEEAAERVIAGLRRDNLISKDEKALVATHESGHAVSSWFLKGADPLVKVTIVPRSKGALGYAQYLTPDDDIHTKSSLMDRITFILGGRVAEEIFYGKISTGAQDDLEKAFKLAHAIVTRLGMTAEFPYSNFAEEERRNQFMPSKENVKFSDHTQDRIDQLIIGIIQECHARCTQLLLDKRELVQRLRDALLEKESLALVDLEQILGERPVHPEGTLGFRLHSDSPSTGL